MNGTAYINIRRNRDSNRARGVGFLLQEGGRQGSLGVRPEYYQSLPGFGDSDAENYRISKNPANNQGRNNRKART